MDKRTYHKLKMRHYRETDPKYRQYDRKYAQERRKTHRTRRFSFKVSGLSIAKEDKQRLLNDE